MHRFFLFFFFFLFTLRAEAQLKKGSTFLGTDILKGTINPFQQEQDQSFSFRPKVGYLLTNKIGLDVGVEMTQFYNQKKKVYEIIGYNSSITFFQKVNFLTEKSYLYANLGINYSQTTFFTIKANDTNINAKLGALYFIVPNIALDANLNVVLYEKSQVINPTPKKQEPIQHFNLIQFSAGAKLFFNTDRHTNETFDSKNLFAKGSVMTAFSLNLQKNISSDTFFNKDTEASFSKEFFLKQQFSIQPAIGITYSRYYQVDTAKYLYVNPSIALNYYYPLFNRLYFNANVAVNFQQHLNLLTKKRSSSITEYSLSMGFGYFIATNLTINPSVKLLNSQYRNSSNTTNTLFSILPNLQFSYRLNNKKWWK
jgi:hypothetical protein